MTDNNITEQEVQRRIEIAEAYLWSQATTMRGLVWQHSLAYTRWLINL